jgi:hypothetical protein
MRRSLIQRLALLGRASASQPQGSSLDAALEAGSAAGALIRAGRSGPQAGSACPPFLPEAWLLRPCRRGFASLEPGANTDASQLPGAAPEAVRLRASRAAARPHAPPAPQAKANPFKAPKVPGPKGLAKAPAGLPERRTKPVSGQLDKDVAACLRAVPQGRRCAAVGMFLGRQLDLGALPKLLKELQASLQMGSHMAVRGFKHPEHALVLLQRPSASSRGGESSAVGGGDGAAAKSAGGRGPVAEAGPGPGSAAAADGQVRGVGPAQPRALELIHARHVTKAAPSA